MVIVITALLTCNISFAEESTDDKNISQDNIISTAKKLDTYIKKENKLLNTLDCRGYKLSIPEFTYLMAKTIQNKKNNNFSDISLKKGIKYPNLPIGDDIEKNIYLKDYYNFVLRTSNYIDTYNKLPNYLNDNHKYGIKFHVWFCAFKIGGNWINPIDTKTKSYNYSHFNKILKRVDRYSKIKAFDGIHLDYVRYPGVSLKACDYNYSNGITGDKAVTKFIKMAKKIAKKDNNKIILSAALMPEPNRSIRLYGQNTKELSKHLDVLIPMVYKTAFGKDNRWVTKMTKWYRDRSNGADVWVGLEVYGKGVKSLSPQNMISYASSAIKGGANGLVLFRYKLWKITNLLKAY